MGQAETAASVWGCPWDKLLCLPEDKRVNPEPALSCPLNSLLAMASKHGERRKYGCFRDSLAGRGEAVRKGIAYGTVTRGELEPGEEKHKSRKDDMGNWEKWDKLRRG